MTWLLRKVFMELKVNLMNGEPVLLQRSIQMQTSPLPGIGLDKSLLVESAILRVGIFWEVSTLSKTTYRREGRVLIGLRFLLRRDELRHWSLISSFRESPGLQFQKWARWPGPWLITGESSSLFDGWYFGNYKEGLLGAKMGLIKEKNFLFNTAQLLNLIYFILQCSTARTWSKNVSEISVKPR